MKKTYVLIALPLLLIAKSALGQPNVLGEWSVKQLYIHSNGDYGDVTETIMIDFQVGNRFSGCVWNGDLSDPPERGEYFSGVIVGRRIYITHWDSITRGRVSGNGMRMWGINHAFDPEPEDRTSKTSIARATKVDEAYSECPKPLPPPPP